MTAHSIKGRLHKLEERQGMTTPKHSHIVTLSAGNQSEEEIHAEVGRVCRERGIYDDPAGMFLLVHVGTAPSPAGPVCMDRPIVVDRIGRCAA